MVRDRQLIDWRIRIDDLVAEMRELSSDLEEMDAQGELDAAADRLESLETELEIWQESHCG